MKKVVSFSGGRTSAYFCKVMIDKFGRDNVDFIYMDTGAEHPKTYEFIKKVDEYLGLNLVCLRGKFDQAMGKGHTYEIVSVDDLKCDLLPFDGYAKKYGTPTVAGASCTSRMKEETHDKYCNDTYGKGGYETWIGIRADEPKRYLGEDLYRALNTDVESDYQFFSGVLKNINLNNGCFYGEYDVFQGMWCEPSRYDKCVFDNEFDRAASLVEDRYNLLHKKRLRYMAEITDAEKKDVLDWWKGQPFDLEIDEHLGNCVFCVKKGPNKLALASRDEPGLYKQFLDLIDNANPREDLTKKPPKEIMYRKKQSLIQIVSLYENHTRDEIAQTIRGMKSMDTGSCSESCEVFSSE